MRARTPVSRWMVWVVSVALLTASMPAPAAAAPPHGAAATRLAASPGGAAVTQLAAAPVRASAGTETAAASSQPTSAADEPPSRLTPEERARWSEREPAAGRSAPEGVSPDDEAGTAAPSAEAEEGGEGGETSGPRTLWDGPPQGAAVPAAAGRGADRAEAAGPVTAAAASREQALAEIRAALAASEDGTVAVIVRLADPEGRADPWRAVAELESGRGGASRPAGQPGDRGRGLGRQRRTERARAVVEHLKAAFEEARPQRQRVEQAARASGRFEYGRDLWILHGFSARVDARALDALARQPDVASIELDEVFTLPEPEFGQPPRLPEWNLEKVFAPRVWGELGIRGEGVIVASLDTGVDLNHPALSASYLGNEVGHEHAWFVATGEDYPMPGDELGHGTHTMGTIVGGPPGEVIGVAPGARWISAKIFDDLGRATASGIHAAFQWLLAPGGDPAYAPDVVNNSWGSAATYHTEFWDDVQALLAAGIFPVFSAGNSGPAAETIGSPASFPHALAVGATDSADVVAFFSSRGPVFWEGQEFIKPDIAAPGHLVRSAWPTHLPEGPYNTISGTSMAAPHVTGVVALMRSADPDLTVDEIREALLATARREPHMGPLPNNHYGHGIVDAYAAVVYAAFSGELVGVVRTAAGEPLAASVSVPGTHDHTETDPATGAYRLRLPEGTWEVVVRSFGYLEGRATVQVVRGAEVTRDFHLEPAPIRTLTGSVTYQGAPVAGARVWLKGAPLAPVRTGADGGFRIAGVPEGTYLVQAHAPGFSLAQREVSLAGPAHVDLELAPLEQPHQAEWPTYKNNPTRAGFTADEIAPERLRRIWTFTGPGSTLFASPTLADGRLFMAFERGRLVAVDAATGKPLWSFTAGESMRTTPTVADGRVFFGGGNDRTFYALDAATGQVLWTYETDQLLTYTTPVVAGGAVIFAGGWGTGDGGDVIALDAETGERLWQTNIGSQVFLGPALGDGRVYAASYDAMRLVALDPASGQVLWQYQHEGDEGFVSAPTYADGKVFVATANFDTGKGTLLALDAATGALLWARPDHGDAEASSPVYFDGVVIAGSHTRGVVAAYDADSGESLWTTPVAGPVSQAVAVTGNAVVIGGDQGGSLFALDAYTGEILWQETLPNGIISAPAVAGGAFYIADGRGNVYAYLSPAVLAGRIQAADGSPLAARVRVLETGAETTAAADGTYRLEHRPGTYTVEFFQYGYRALRQQVTLRAAVDQRLDVTLAPGEAGGLGGTVTGEDGRPLAGVTVALPDTPLDPVVTDSDGRFAFPQVIEGTYRLTLREPHHVPVDAEVTIKAGEETIADFVMRRYVAAVIGDYQGLITAYLNEQLHVPAHERGWEMAADPADLGAYRLVVVNGAQSDPGGQVFRDFVAAADAAGVSLIFLDQWGLSYGSIRQLVEYLGDPASLGDGYADGDVYVEKLLPDHPILAGVPDGRLNLLEHNQEYAFFNGFSGTPLMRLGTGEHGWRGTAVAVDLRTPISTHVLLASHAASPWAGPQAGWTATAHRLFANAVSFAVDGRFGVLEGTVTDAATGLPLAATVRAVDAGAQAGTDPATGRYRLVLLPGTYRIEIRALGYAPVIQDVTLQPGETRALDAALIQSGAGAVTGRVTAAHSGEPLAGVTVTVTGAGLQQPRTAQSGADGTYLVDAVPEGIYSVRFTLAGYLERTFADVTVTAGSGVTLDVALTEQPRVAVLYDSVFDPMVDFLNGMGFAASEHTWQNLGDPGAYDVIVVNKAATSGTDPGREAFLAFLQSAAAAGTSVVFPTDYGSSYGGARLLAAHTGEPQVIGSGTRRGQVYYEVEAEHPIFGAARPGDRIPVFAPNAYFGEFAGFTGIRLAKLATDLDGVRMDALSYRPTSKDSVLVVTAGLASTLWSEPTADWTDEGRELLRNLILWAAHPHMGEITGTLQHEGGTPLVNLLGEPIPGTVRVLETGVAVETDPLTGAFRLPHPEGTWTIEFSAPGYLAERMTIALRADETVELQPVELAPAAEVGVIEGQVLDFLSGEPLAGVTVRLPELRRAVVTGSDGRFRFHTVPAPGAHLSLEAEGYPLWDDWQVPVTPGETTSVTYRLYPQPQVGVLNDYQDRLTQLLRGRGYTVHQITWNDLDLLQQLDLVILNINEFDDDIIDPGAEGFAAFQDAATRAGVPVIWMGQHNRGAIRYLVRYHGDPAATGQGSSDGLVYAEIDEAHPLTAPFAPGSRVPIIERDRNYAYFEGYTGHVVAGLATDRHGRRGQLIGYRARGVDGVDVLLGTHTVGFYGGPGNRWTREAEMLFVNALQWALTAPSLGGEVRGHVRSANGAPLAATLRVVETGRVHATHPDDGSFVIGGEPGTVTLEVSAFGHLPVTLTAELVAGQVTSLDVTLQPEAAGTLTGLVTDASTGQPVAGAAVELVGTPLSTTSGADGRYTLSVPVGTYRVRVSAPGYMLQELEGVPVGEGQVVTLDFALAPSTRIAVLGDYTLSGAPPGGSITAFLRQQGYQVDRYLSSSSDPAFEDLMAQLSRYRVIIHNGDSFRSNLSREQAEALLQAADQLGISMIFATQWGGYAWRDLAEVTGEPAQIISSFTPEAVTYLIRAGHPILAGYGPGDVITLLRKPGQNQQYQAFEGYSGEVLADLGDADGDRLGGAVAYRFVSPRSAHVLLGALSASGVYGRPELNWTEDAKRIFLQAVAWAMNARLAEIRGTVRDAGTGEPIAGARVAVMETGQEVVTDAGGGYAFGIGAGTFTLRVEAYGYEPAEQQVTVASGQTVVVDFVLSPTTTGRIEGTVTDADTGEAIAGAEVRLVGHPNPVPVVTDGDGRFAFEQVVPGTYTLSVAAKGYQPKTTGEVTVAPGLTTRVDVALDHNDVAVLGDYREGDGPGALLGMLLGFGSAAEDRDWEGFSPRGYDVVIVNDVPERVGAITGTQALADLIDEAAEAGVSLIFTDTWGVEEGSVDDLVRLRGAAALQLGADGYREGVIAVGGGADPDLAPSSSGLPAHPLLAGLAAGDELMVRDGYYATIDSYEGWLLGRVVSEAGGDRGWLAGYDYTSADSVHVLLAPLAATGLSAPNYGWAEGAGRLFRNAVDWARNARQPAPGPITVSEPADGLLTRATTVRVAGTAGFRDWIVIERDGRELARQRIDRSLHYQVEVALTEGVNDLTATGHNYAGATHPVRLRVISDTTPPDVAAAPDLMENLEGRWVTNEDSVTVRGAVYDAFGVAGVTVAGVPAAVDEEGGFAAEVALAPGVNAIEITARDEAGNERRVTLEVTRVAFAIDFLPPLEPGLTVNPNRSLPVAFRAVGLGGAPDPVEDTGAVVQLRDAAGTVLAELRVGDGLQFDPGNGKKGAGGAAGRYHGVLRLKDLGLAPGTYHLIVFAGAGDGDDAARLPALLTIDVRDSGDTEEQSEAVEEIPPEPGPQEEPGPGETPGDESGSPEEPEGGPPPGGGAAAPRPGA